MNKNKWLVTLLALTIPLSIQAEEVKNASSEKAEEFVIPEPASLSIKPENKFRETGRVISFLDRKSVV